MRKYRKKLKKKKEKGSICVPLMWLPQYRDNRRTLILSSNKEVLVEGRSINTQNVDFEISPPKKTPKTFSLSYFSFLVFYIFYVFFIFIFSYLLFFLFVLGRS